MWRRHKICMAIVDMPIFPQKAIIRLLKISKTSLISAGVSVHSDRAPVKLLWHAKLCVHGGGSSTVWVVVEVMIYQSAEWKAGHRVVDAHFVSQSA